MFKKRLNENKKERKVKEVLTKHVPLGPKKRPNKLPPINPKKGKKIIKSCIKSINILCLCTG